MRYLSKCMFVVVATLCSLNTFAAFNQYEKTHIVITNKTKYDELVRIYDTQGVWEKSVANNVLFTLKPGEVYENTLNSVVGHYGLESYTGVSVIRQNSPKENYLIFGESAASDRHETFCDIFDGLGDMFVSSWMNHCRDKAADGYPLCKLDVLDNS